MSLNSSFYAAVKDGDMEALAQCVATQDINGTFYDNRTPLTLAAYWGKCNSLSYLVNHGADMMRLDANGETALTSAIIGSEPAALSWLLQNGANPLQRNQQGYTARQVAMSRQNTDFAKMLQKHEEERNADFITFYRQLIDRVAQDSYDFINFERITLVRPALDGPVEAATVKNFSELNEAPLRRAFNEHVKRGGKCTEEQVFTSDRHDVRAAILKQRKAQP